MKDLNNLWQKVSIPALPPAPTRSTSQGFPTLPEAK